MCSLGASLPDAAGVGAADSVLQPAAPRLPLTAGACLIVRVFVYFMMCVSFVFTNNAHGLEKSRVFLRVLLLCAVLICPLFFLSFALKFDLTLLLDFACCAP